MRRVKRGWPLRAVAFLLGLILGACFMPHGYPPWSGIKRDTIFAVPLDLGELAVRLGAQVIYDRRGSVVYLEGFEHGLGSWGKATAGTLAAARLSTAQCLSSGFSVELVAGSDGERYAGLDRYLPFPAEGKVGLEVSFTLDPETAYLLFALRWYDGTNVRLWVVKYDHENGVLSCGGGDGGHTTLNSALSLRVRDNLFHTLKFVMDMEEESFVRVLLDALAYTPTTAAISKTADNTAASLEIVTRHYSIAAPVTNPNIWIDNVVLTQEEED